MEHENRGFYPTDSLNQEQTEFYTEYASYQYHNDATHYHDEGLFIDYNFNADQSFPHQIRSKLL